MFEETLHQLGLLASGGEAEIGELSLQVRHFLGVKAGFIRHYMRTVYLRAESCRGMGREKGSHRERTGGGGKDQR